MINTLKELMKNTQILTSKDAMLAYTKDASYSTAVFPKAVVFAQKSSDVGLILEWANNNKVPVTVRGAGTGKSGGCIPDENGIVLSMERLNSVLEIDTNNKMVVTQPGVILNDLQEACLSENLWLPLDPSSQDKCTIGGMVIENAGGPRALKYGVTGDYVCGLEGYFGDGKPFKFGGKLYKDVAGYDLKKLLVGSEGTLGIITKITLKCIPPVKEELSMWITFNSLKEGVDFVRNKARSTIQPATAEFMQKECILAVENTLNIKIEHSDEKAHVLIMLDGADKTILEAQANEMISELSPQSKVIIATDKNEQDHLWLARREISEALTSISKHKVSEDVTLPPFKISEFMEKLSKLDSTSSYSFIGYGHLGDGNIHVNILNNHEDESTWEKAKVSLIDQVMNLGLSCGGTPTGEHGIGLTKKKYMSDYFSSHEIDVMRKIKAIFDPNGILNTDKIF
jgi:glycolate oxidase